MTRRLVSVHASTAVATFAALAWRPNYLVAAAGLVALWYLPGDGLLRWWRAEFEIPAVRALVALALGVVVMLTTGYVASMFGPQVGVDRPLDTVPQLAAAGGVLIAATLLRSAYPRSGGRWNLARLGTWVGVRAVLPCGAAIGALRINATGDATVARWTLHASAVMVLGAVVATLWRGDVQRWRNAVAGAFYSASLAVMWGTTLRGDTVFGWDIQRESSVARATVAAGRWSRSLGDGAYESMLSITSLPAQVHALTGFATDTVLRVIYPMCFAAVPVLVFYALTRLSTVRAAAALTAVTVLATRAFPRQMPAIARQEIALFLFAALVAVLLHDGVRKRARQWIVAVLVAGIACSHYTTAYATLVLFTGAWVVSGLLTVRRRSLRESFTLTTPVVAWVAAAVLGWNLVLAPSGVVFDRPTEQVTTVGVEFLTSEPDAGVLDRWLRGSSARLGSVETYETLLVDEFDGELDWLVPDVAIAATSVSDARAPRFDGVVPAIAPWWQRGYIAATQLLGAVLGGAALWALWRSVRRRDVLNVELIGAVIAALTLNIVLRTSGWAGQFYNPERGAFHNGLLLIIPAAVAFDMCRGTWRRIGSVLVLAATVGTLGTTWGNASLLFGGNPPAAVTSAGEDVERFAVTAPEVAGARYLAAHLGDGDVVQADRYGQLRLLNQVEQSSYTWISIYHPAAIHTGSYLYSSRTNVIDGRARGKSDNILAIYTSPLPAIDDVRNGIYVNDEVRVHR